MVKVLKESRSSIFLDERPGFPHDRGVVKPTRSEPELEPGVKILPVVGFEGLYSVTDDGRVWSHGQLVTHRSGRVFQSQPKWLKASHDGSGYRSVILYKDRRRFPKKIYTLVAFAFMGPRLDGAQIDHIDRNRGNDNVGNLRYVSRSKNQLNNGARGYTRLSRGLKKWQARVQWNGDSRYLGTYSTKEEAQEAYSKAKNLLLNAEH